MKDKTKIIQTHLEAVKMTQNAPIRLQSGFLISNLDRFFETHIGFVLHYCEKDRPGAAVPYFGRLVWVWSEVEKINKQHAQHTQRSS